jgi:hypothetical protein
MPDARRSSADGVVVVGSRHGERAVGEGDVEAGGRIGHETGQGARPGRLGLVGSAVDGQLQPGQLDRRPRAVEDVDLRPTWLGEADLPVDRGVVETVVGAGEDEDRHAQAGELGSDEVDGVLGR